MPQIAYVGIVPGDKKKVAYVTSYSKLGLVWVHVFQAAKSAEALEVVEALQSRKDQAAEQKSKVPATGNRSMTYVFVFARVLFRLRPIIHCVLAATVLIRLLSRIPIVLFFFLIFPSLLLLQF